MVVQGVGVSEPYRSRKPSVYRVCVYSYACVYTVHVNKAGGVCSILRSDWSIGFSSFWNETDLDLAPFGMKHDIVPKIFPIS